MPQFHSLKMKILILAAGFCVAHARYLNVTFAYDNPALVNPTLRFTDGSVVYTDYPALTLQPGEEVTFDQSDSSNAGLSFLISDPAFSVTYNCPGLSSCSAADYAGLNGFRFVSASPTNDAGTIVKARDLAGLTQTITAPLVSTSSSYHIAGYPYNGNSITVTVDKSTTAELYALTVLFPFLFVVTNEAALRFLTIDKRKRVEP